MAVKIVQQMVVLSLGALQTRCFQLLLVLAASQSLGSTALAHSDAVAEKSAGRALLRRDGDDAAEAKASDDPQIKTAINSEVICHITDRSWKDGLGSHMLGTLHTMSLDGFTMTGNNSKAVRVCVDTTRKEFIFMHNESDVEGAAIVNYYKGVYKRFPTRHLAINGLSCPPPPAKEVRLYNVSSNMLYALDKLVQSGTCDPGSLYQVHLASVFTNKSRDWQCQKFEDVAKFFVEDLPVPAFEASQGQGISTTVAHMRFGDRASDEDLQSNNNRMSQLLQVLAAQTMMISKLKDAGASANSSNKVIVHTDDISKAKELLKGATGKIPIEFASKETQVLQALSEMVHANDFFGTTSMLSEAAALLRSTQGRRSHLPKPIRWMLLQCHLSDGHGHVAEYANVAESPAATRVLHDLLKS